MGESSEALGAVKKEEASDHVSRQQTTTTDTAVKTITPLFQQDISPYNPNTYKCQDYGNDKYQWFDGLPGEGKDQEFTIDLKDGSMDRLRDIRPYLYYVGFWSGPSTTHKTDIETLERSMIEETYVTMGRRYLLEEQSHKRGYFLAQRDWASFNDPICQGFPFRRLVWEEPEESDHGFEEFHENTEYEGDSVRMVIKTNTRTPLPPQSKILTSPDSPRWDTFIRWIYAPDIHGAYNMVNSGISSDDVVDWRMSDGSRAGWMKREDDGRYRRCVGKV